MYTIRQYYGSADLVYTYVVGFAHSKNDFVPLVATDRLHYAVHMVNALNGGAMPNDITTFTNVMQATTTGKRWDNVEAGSTPGDFKMGTLPYELVAELEAKTNGEHSTDVDQHDGRRHRQGGSPVE